MIAIPTAKDLPSPSAGFAPATASNILVAVRNRAEQQRLADYLKGFFSGLLVPSIPGIYKTLEMRQTGAIIIDMESFPGESPLLCAQLKSSPHFGHIPVILLYSASNARLRIQCLEAGADALLGKPYSKTHLLAQIRNLDRNRTRIMEYFAKPHPYPASTETFATSPAPTGNSDFLKKLNNLISTNLSNADLNIDLLAQLMNMSRPTFYRKLKATTQTSPALPTTPTTPTTPTSEALSTSTTYPASPASPLELINSARLKKAAELITKTDHTIAEVVRMVGFRSRSNFGKAFFKQFQTSPLEFRNSHKRN